MLTTADRKIKLDSVKAQKKAVYLKPESKYTNGELSFKVNKATGKKWRLVHDTKKVITLIEGTDKDTTTTIHEILELSTEKEAMKAVDTLGLTIEEAFIVEQVVNGIGSKK